MTAFATDSVTMATTPTFSSFTDALTQAADARALGDTNRAVDIYKRLPTAFPTKKSAIAVAADGLLDCGRWSDAVAILNAALAVMPISPLVLERLARAHFSMGNYQRAATYLRQHALRDSTNPENWIKLGSIEAAGSDWASAEASFRQALALDPINEAAALGLGDALHQLRRTEEGVELYRRAVVTNPGDGQALFKLGSALLHLHVLDEAEAVLRRAIKTDPSNAGAWVNLAVTCSRRGQLGKALGFCKTANKVDPKSPAAHFTLGSMLLDSGQIADAAVALRTAVELAPGSVEALSAMATAETLLGDNATAERALQRVLELEPGNIEARHLLAALRGDPVTTAPDGYNAQLFDWFAGRFDHHMVATLQYCVPRDVAVLLSEGSLNIGRRYLDLGCGTGLMAAALADIFQFERKVGIDISGKMVDVARGKKLYDEVIHGDVITLLGGMPNAFDLITAGDLLPYVGDLAALMPVIGRCLGPGGLFVYSIETLAEGGYKLLQTGRFAHTVTYVDDLARAADMAPVALRHGMIRTNAGKPIAGVIGVLQKRA